ncbi:MAG: LptF/LptG family permease [Crocinitomicaceae bacterium]
MLKIIDRYIIKKFLSTFFFMLGVIMVLAMVFDLSEKLGEFIDNKASLYDVVFQYYLNFILFYGNMFSSMIIFVSVIWFTAKMAQDTEIIPIWNSGRKFGRFVRPYLIAATILMIISLIFNHFIIPPSNKVRLQFEEKYYRVSISIVDYHAEFPSNEIVYFSSYSADTDLINDFTVEKWDGKGKLKGFIKAATARNIQGTHKWELYNYYERKVGYPNDVIVEGAKKDTSFQFDIGEMATRDNVAEAMNYFELKEFIERERQKGSSKVAMYEIELYQRTSYPFAAYVLTIIGIAVASRKKRGGVGINIAIGLGIIFIYIFAMKVTTVAAINLGFSASIAVWVPNFIFAGVAYILYKRAKR